MTVPLAASHRVPMRGARRTGQVDGTEHAEVTVVVRRRASVEGAISAQAHNGGGPLVTEHVGHDEFADRYGADPADIQLVADFAASSHLTVVSSDLGRRTVVLDGSLADLASAFGVELGRYETDSRHYRGREGTVMLPTDLDSVVVGVFGLDNRPSARPHLRANNRQHEALTAADIARLYHFPTGHDGTGETIGLIELGGGYQTSDLRTYARGIGIPVPKVVDASVDGATRSKSVDGLGSSDSEVALDLQVAAAIAPGAKFVMYFAPNTERGFLDAMAHAVHDSANRPSVLSVSWGQAESAFTQQAQDAFDDVLTDAALLGITVCCSTGDNGSSAGLDDGAAHVELPASSPHALACGGTFLTPKGDAVHTEVVWHDGSGGASGGGVSDVFDVPVWQHAASVPHSANKNGRVGRGVPDIAGNADDTTAYRIVLAGQWQAVGGTSGVAPLVAGLVARANQRLGRRLGWLNPSLYDLAKQGMFREITEGNNGAYQAGPGWNACTGLGVPHGEALVAALAALTPAPAKAKQH